MAAAAHVQRENPDAKVVVVDRASACAQGNTARSAALVRNTFTSETNLWLTDSSIDFYKHLRDDRREEVGLKLYGYLWLMDAAGLEKNRAAIERMKAHKIEVELFDRSELERIPGLRCDFAGDEEAQVLRLRNIDHGLFGAKCGQIEPDLLTQVYERDFLRLGGRFRGVLSDLPLAPYNERSVEELHANVCVRLRQVRSPLRPLPKLR